MVVRVVEGPDVYTKAALRVLMFDVLVPAASRLLVVAVDLDLSRPVVQDEARRIVLSASRQSLR
eukprot:15599652-Heterocapsa_arctica.AAC.1